jgi:hypothetical protein
MRVSVVLFTFLCIAVFSAGAAEDYTIESIVFLPPKHYIGDPVEARIALNVARGAVVAAPKSYPSDEICTVRSVSVSEEKESTIVRIEFTSFAIGKQELPALTLGDITLTGVEFETASLLDEHSVEFRDIREQLFLPGTYLLIIVVTSVIVLSFFVIVPGFRLIKRVITSMIDRRKKRLPFLRLAHVVDSLHKQIDALDGKAFYSELCAGVKRYFRDRLHIELSTKTTSETDAVLKEIFGEENDRQRIIVLFEFADKVKFGGFTASSEQRKRDLEHIVNVTKSMEEAEEHRVES